ncbi:hypothetical protein E2C01_053202 [Portunus trituberculatus]|uniref:Uncharacterized protein n=1 Tax=Portunus trituberculatus TaxID=210409 RepID=A0A5B7GPP6_PORTR|nr:hypothetical protein [Portunus trituberculatus]
MKIIHGGVRREERGGPEGWQLSLHVYILRVSGSARPRLQAGTILLGGRGSGVADTLLAIKFACKLRKNITTTHLLSRNGEARAGRAAPDTLLRRAWHVKGPSPGKRHMYSCPGCQIQSITLNDPYVAIRCSVSLVETFLRITVSGGEQHIASGLENLMHDDARDARDKQCCERGRDQCRAGRLRAAARRAFCITTSGHLWQTHQR